MMSGNVYLLYITRCLVSYKDTHTIQVTCKQNHATHPRQSHEKAKSGALSPLPMDRL
jgi:hypothetical protein